MESTILPLELAYEHRNYIPSMLFFVPFAIGYCSLLERFRAKSVMRFAVAFFGVIALVGFGHATYVRNLAWKNPETLWLDAAAKSPGESRVHHNLGAQYQGKGQAHEAMEAYEKALNLHKYQRKGEEAAVYFNLGNLHRDLGSADRAQYFYQQAIKVDPNCYPALNGLAVLYERQGRMDAVLPLLRKALEVEPETSHASFNLGLFHLKSGEPEKAVPYFNIAVRDQGLQHAVLVCSGVAYKQMGQRGKAAGFFGRAILTNPRDLTPRLHLVEIYHALGLKSRALDQGESLLDILLMDEGLFYNTVNFILEKGGSKEIDLSGEMIIPILQQVMSKRGEIFNSQLSYLKKILDKDSKIE
jgi:tetratricopeptide (TPR) repeat protein